MRVPVVDNEGKQLMPCTPAKARVMLKAKEARPKWNKLGLFYLQLNYVVEQPNNQPLIIGVDPGSGFEGYSVVGTKDTVLNIMAKAPKHVKQAVETRRDMRRARRQRKCWRRPRRENRTPRAPGHALSIPPSTRSRWEAKARIVAQLAKILPLTDVVVEDIITKRRKGKGGQWALAFNPIQVGKEHLYYLLQKMGLTLHKCEGQQTADLRKQLGLTKTKQKDKKAFSSHCIDSWVMAASISGAIKQAPSAREKRLHYLTEIRLWRRQLHVLQPAKAGVRRAYGGTRSLGVKIGTLMNDPKYGLSSVDGCTNGKLILNAYAGHQRLTKGAKLADCRILTSSVYRTTVIKMRDRTIKPRFRWDRLLSRLCLKPLALAEKVL